MNNPTQYGASRALAIAAGLVIIALTAAAFWLSYAHLAEVAAQHGLQASPVRAWAWPATLDLFIVAGELLMLRAALDGRTDPWAIGLTVVGSGGSIALNVAGVGTAAGTLDYVVAAVPPTAALLAFGALMRQVHQALAPTTEVTTAPTTEVTIERADETPVPVAPVVARPVIAPPTDTLLWDDYATSKATSAVAAETPREVVTSVVTRTPADLRRDARRMHRQVVTSGGRGVTIEQLRAAFDLSRREAAELRRQVVTEVTA